MSQNEFFHIDQYYVSNVGPRAAALVEYMGFIHVGKWIRRYLSGRHKIIKLEDRQDQCQQNKSKEKHRTPIEGYTQDLSQSNLKFTQRLEVTITWTLRDR